MEDDGYFMLLPQARRGGGCVLSLTSHLLLPLLV
jgi:hypothetical protein